MKKWAGRELVRLDGSGARKQALLATLAFCAVHGRRIPLPKYLAGSAAVLVLGWLAFWAGSGPYYYQIAPGLLRISEVPSELLNLTKLARIGFLRSGGSSNIVVPLRDNAAAGLELDAGFLSRGIRCPILGLAGVRR